MTQPETVTINGVRYDKHTGMPLRASAKPTHSPHAASAQALHSHVERSHRLRRSSTKSTAPSTPQSSDTKPASPQTHKPTPAITKFAPHPKPVVQQTRVISDIGPSVHPMVQRVAAARATTSTPKTHKPSDVLKKEAIDKALAPSPAVDKHKRERNKQKQPRSKKSRFAMIATAATTLLLVGGYFTYINMPALSVRVAAAQAGVNATYPAYHPSGYSLSGAVAYNSGSVSMKFAQNGGPDSYTLKQTASGWDSEALLSNYVTPKAGQSYLTTRDSGLTIYTFGTNAAWVSGGIMYTITGDAPLSTDQVTHIATSL